MITKKEQMIVDAVNLFHGEFTIKGLNESDNVIAYAELECDLLGWHLVGENNGSIGFGYKLKHVCTLEEFNVMVVYMSEHTGCSEHFEYKRNIKSPLTKENSDYSYYKKENKMQNVYTQEMKYNGVLPSVGMRCKVENEWFFVGVDSQGDWVLEDCKFNEPKSFRPKDVKPIDTRTHEQKQVDDIYSISTNKGYFVRKGYLMWLQENGHLAEIIKPLESK